VLGTDAALAAIATQPPTVAATAAAEMSIFAPLALFFRLWCDFFDDALMTRPFGQ
jgi:hypothetical protein